MKTYTSKKLTIEAKTLKEARFVACGMLSVDGPQSLKFRCADGSGFAVSLWAGQDHAWDRRGRTIPGKRLVCG